MGSRLKQNPERTFYWFFEATCPVARDRDPGVQFSFPEDFTDEETYQTIPRFCFPYDIQRARDGVAVQHFTFALTDLEGCQRFGFCRLTNTSQTCLCILSYLPWFEVFYKLLNNLADYLAKGQRKEARALLAELHKQPVPLASGSVTLSMVSVSTEVSLSVGHSQAPEGVPYFIAPDPKSLPSIPENRNLTELIVAVDVGNLLQLYASMLFERRILIFASKLSTLTSCIHALSAVLYPMFWQHIFIPVLPPHLLDYCCAPMPYLIGVHSSLSERVKSRGLEEVIILNVDTNTLESPFDDIKRIPPDVMSQLKIGLKRQAVSPGCGVSRAFLRTQALLFGGYREALHTQDGGVSFNKDLFLDHKSNSMRQFLQSAVHLQCFKQFVDSRVDILNTGQEPEDLFEEEIQNCEDSPGKPRSYQQLVGNIRKGGGALILNVKSNMKAKGLTKSGLKNLLVHKSNSEELSLQRGGSLSHRRGASHGLQDRLPITQRFDKSRPLRPIHRYRALRDEGNTEDGAWDRVESKHDSDDHREEEVGEDEEDDPLLCDPEEMDLLGEIFDTLSSRSSHDRGVLYCTRSLDLFGPDSHDYITKRSLINPSQESLCISGSGSLHSWHQETAEDLSDLMEEWDQLSLHKTEKVETEETLVMSDYQQQDGENSLQRDEETSESSGEQVNEKGEETSLFQERAADVEEVDDTNTNSSEDSHATEKDKTFSEDELTKPSKDETTEKPKELIRNQVTGKTDHGPSPSPSHQSVPVTPEKPVEQEACPTRATPPPPKVFSAAARFQSHATIQGPDLKSRLRTLAEVGGSLCSREGQSELTPEEKDLPPINVSELKKRFEA